MLNRATFVEDIPSCLLAKKELILLAGISLSGLSPASSKWEEEMEKSLGRKRHQNARKARAAKISGIGLDNLSETPSRSPAIHKLLN